MRFNVRTRVTRLQNVDQDEQTISFQVQIEHFADVCRGAESLTWTVGRDVGC
jgi:hypothetical protein